MTKRTKKCPRCEDMHNGQYEECPRCIEDVGPPLELSPDNFIAFGQRALDNLGLALASDSLKRHTTAGERNVLRLADSILSRTTHLLPAPTHVEKFPKPLGRPEQRPNKT